MIDLKYSLVIEATEDPTFFCFYSPDLRVSPASVTQSKIAYIKPSGVWRNILNCSRNSPFLFPKNPDPRIVIQNQEALARPANPTIHEEKAAWCWVLSAVGRSMLS